MRTITIKLLSDGVSVSDDILGRAGESNVVQLSINFDALRESGLTTATVLFRPPSSPALPMTSTALPDSGDLLVTVPDWAMPNRGTTQVQLLLEGDDVAVRSYVWNMRVLESLINRGEKPQPVQDWLDEIDDAADRANAAADRAESVTGFRVIDYFDSYYTLVDAVPDPYPGDAYGVGLSAPYDIYVYGETSGWVNMGPLAGDSTGDGGGGGEAGEDGGYYKPDVSAAGDLSWTPSKIGMPSVTTVNIKGPQGPQGEKGETGAQGPQGETGAEGPAGADGYSPTITTTAIDGGHQITITDVNGTRTINVWDGKDGSGDGTGGGSGADGYSPTITVAEIEGGHRLTITDVNGSRSVDVMDGVDGQDGSAGEQGPAGNDGVSATHSWEGTVLSITSASGTSSADLKGETGAAGADGQPGEDGSDGVGIQSVEQTTTSAEDNGENVVTIALTNGSTFTFTVKNGSKGSTGDAGAAGQPGEDGYSPVRGTDYWTESDIAEIKAYVDEAILGGEW